MQSINFRESPHQKAERALKNGLQYLYEVWRFLLRNLMGSGQNPYHSIHIPLDTLHGIKEMLTHSLKYMPTQDERPKTELAKTVKFFEDHLVGMNYEQRWLEIPIGRTTTMILEQLEAGFSGYGVSNADGHLNGMMY